MEILFNKFPREFGNKRRVIYTKEEFITIIDKYNGIINCFTSLYPIISRNKYDGQNIDKIFFDLDKPQDCIEKALKMHLKLKEMDLRHCILFSGRGIHIYVFCKIASLQYAKYALKLGQEYLVEECGLSIGKPKNSDVDEHIIGDVARISRIPNTYNPKRKRYCIYLKEEDLYKSYHEIRELAKKQRFKIFIYGNKLFDIQQFDTIPQVDLSLLEYEDVDEIEVTDSIMSILPPFVRKSLLDREDGYRSRYVQILVMRECGIPIDTAIEICKKNWSKKKFHHAIHQEATGRKYGQFGYLYYDRPDLFIPNWETLISQYGFHIHKKDLEWKFYE